MAERWAWKEEPLGGGAVLCGDACALEDGRPEDLVLCTDDKNERSGNRQPMGIQWTHAQSQRFQRHRWLRGPEGALAAQAVEICPDFQIGGSVLMSLAVCSSRAPGRRQNSPQPIVFSFVII